MSKYPLLDINHGADDRHLHELYLTAAKIALKYGHNSSIYHSRSQILEFWGGPDSERPSRSAFHKITRAPTVKWYIHNELKLADSIWNEDFVHGMSRNGSIQWNKSSYPTLYLYNNNSLRELIELSPFGGRLKGNEQWKFVPALYLKFEETTLSFLAGLLAGGNIVELDGKQYVSYHRKVKSLFIDLGIPIERLESYRFWISPVWPSIMTLWMPHEVRAKWTTLKKPIEAEEYCPILWKTYVGSNFKTKGMPYLRSRRTIYYKYHSVEAIQRMRVSKGLAMLDNRFREAIHIWSSNEISNN